MTIIKLEPIEDEEEQEEIENTLTSTEEYEKYVDYFESVGGSIESAEERYFRQPNGGRRMFIEDTTSENHNVKIICNETENANYYRLEISENYSTDN